MIRRVAWTIAPRAFAMAGLLLLALILAGSAARGDAAPQPGTKEALRITVAYDNLPHRPGLTTDWGFAAVVESGGERVLFDTGGDGRILLENLARLGIPPRSIDAVVLSHAHSDHTGGLDALLPRHAGLTVYVPRSFGAAFGSRLERSGAWVQLVDEPRRLRGNLHTTGELGDAPREQALVIDTSRGLVVLTGCAHPGVVPIVTAAKDQLGGAPVHLVMGGFHLRDRSDAEIEGIIDELRALGVQRVAPSHCTGQRAIKRFRAVWGDAFVEGGCGAVVEVR